MVRLKFYQLFISKFRENNWECVKIENEHWNIPRNFEFQQLISFNKSKITQSEDAMIVWCSQQKQQQKL